MKCPNCNDETPSGKFCSHCGSNLIQSDIVPKVFNSKAKITISFGKSTSKNYTVAVERAMKHPSYSELKEGKEVIHRVDFDFDEIEEIKSILDLVGQWKSTTFYVNDKLTAYSDISQVLYCYSERQKAYNAEEYCYGKDDASTYNDNDLGCRHCGINPYEWRGIEEFGHIEKDGSFTVDKEKLVYTASRSLENFMICPALDIKSIEKKLKAFPTSINPKTNKQWEYVTDYENGKSIAIAVKKKEKRKGDKYVVKDYKSDFETSINVNIPSSAKKAGGCLLPVVVTFLLLLAVLSLII